MALEKTGLWSHFDLAECDTRRPRTPRHILNNSISQFPQMSTGQLQLFAMARAVLQLQHINNSPRSLEIRSRVQAVKPILLLDEVTASLDPVSEAIIRDIIRQEFIERGHTVIMISHRLSGIARGTQTGRDTVAIMSKGKIDKTGSLEELYNESHLGVTRTK